VDVLLTKLLLQVFIGQLQSLVLFIKISKLFAPEGGALSVFVFDQRHLLALGIQFNLQSVDVLLQQRDLLFLQLKKN
jgi:hypothetical protein